MPSETWQPACITTGLGELVDVDGRKHYAGLRPHDLRQLVGHRHQRPFHAREQSIRVHVSEPPRNLVFHSLTDNKAVGNLTTELQAYLSERGAP